MSYPTISFLILCLNEERVIERCLAAIENQISPNDEILLLDTGSNDSTLKIVENNFPDVKVHKFLWTKDFSEARNELKKLASKDWIFNIDCDEILQPGSIENLKHTINEFENISSDPVVFAPKIVNTDDSIDYNSGSIFKNDPNFEYFGCIHEYPIYDKDISAENYYLVKLDNVINYHDGYIQEIMNKKNKAEKYTELNKKMITQFPKSDRYYFLYYRDAESILEPSEYEKGLRDFFELFPNSNYSRMVYDKLIIFYISNGKTDEADEYLGKYWEFLQQYKSESEGKIFIDKITYLSSINEICKISKIQQEILALLINTRSELNRDTDKYVENGYCFDDVIGYLLFSLGDFESALEIFNNLEKDGYSGMLKELFSNKIFLNKDIN
ncbi:glycosyltransferase [Enterococcus gallinarum]|uniref:glycosyltransferase n=1 Tax=Enterococcus gallinarum TaxID=1353 RepID=UPI0027E1AC21|nr:glycosyltransferase [Enterococcus gallinarum]MDQ6112404.1 glycosyltransferase [Enterococcus gallinarum]